MISRCDRCFLFNGAGTLVWHSPQIMIGPPLVDSLLAGTSPFTGAGWLKAARPGGAVRLHMFLSAGAYRGFPRGFSRNALYRFSPVWASLFFLVGGISTYCGG